MKSPNRNKSVVNPEVAAKILELMDCSGTAVGARLRWAREERDLALADLGKLVGLTAQAPQQWEVGRTIPPLERLLQVGVPLEQDALWLATGLVIKEIDEARTNAMKSLPPSRNFAGRKKSIEKRADGDPVSVRLRGSRALILQDIAAFGPAFLEQGLKCVENLSIEFTMTHSPASAQAFAFEIADTRNAPQFEVGDMIFIDPREKVRPGDNVLVVLPDGSSTFGRIRTRADGSGDVLAANPNWHEVPLSKSALSSSVDAPKSGEACVIGPAIGMSRGWKK